MRNNQCNRPSCPANIIRQESPDPTVTEHKQTPEGLGNEQEAWLEKGSGDAD